MHRNERFHVGRLHVQASLFLVYLYDWIIDTGFREILSSSSSSLLHTVWINYAHA